MLDQIEEGFLRESKACAARLVGAYAEKVSGGYEYLADTVLGVDKRERVSAGLSLSLVRAAKDMSYAKSSFYLTDGAISRQTMMGKLRQSYSQKTNGGGRRRLHI
jgi:hypothetical protein